MGSKIPSRRYVVPAMIYLAFTAMVFVTPVLAVEYPVNLEADAFNPIAITLQAGDSVRWINDGGSNNVVEEGGLFRSGDMSTDQWQYSYQFGKGGTYTVFSEQDPLEMRMTVTVEGVFVDGFDFGHLTAWDELHPPRQDCTCYFSADCIEGEMCDYGPAGFSTEDICSWVDVKPEGVPGSGCNMPHVGVWGGEICDGVCSPSRAGSALGSEDRTLLRQGITLWAEAVLMPAEEGGGPLHAGLVWQVEQLGFVQPGSAQILGRQVTDVLILTGGQELYGYFCHHEQHPEDPDPSLWLDFSDQPCRATIARLTIDALLAAIDGGDAGIALREVPGQCADWQSFIAEDCRGAGALACLGRHIEGMAEFLSTPPNSISSLH